MFLKHDYQTQWLYPYHSFKHSDDVTDYVTHRIFNTDLSYSCAHFVVEIDEKSSLNGKF